MTKEQEPPGGREPRACPQCGSPIPAQSKGRPRKWCSQQCRQSAYEERHGLESWKDKQPKIDDLSDVVEVMQERGTKRSAGRPRAVDSKPQHSCVTDVCANPFYMAMVVDAVTDLFINDAELDKDAGIFLATGVVNLVNTVVPIAALHLAEPESILRTAQTDGTPGPKGNGRDIQSR